MMIVAAFLMILLGLNRASAADVAQGKCVKFDTAAKRIILEKYSLEKSHDNPYGKSTGRISEFDTTGAKIGILPEQGDVLRVAYIVEGGIKRAIRVMNVTKQDLRKK
jgi:hypothetical protein